MKKARNDLSEQEKSDTRENERIRKKMNRDSLSEQEKSDTQENNWIRMGNIRAKSKNSSVRKFRGLVKNGPVFVCVVCN